MNLSPSTSSIVQKKAAGAKAKLGKKPKVAVSHKEEDVEYTHSSKVTKKPELLTNVSKAIDKLVLGESKPKNRKDIFIPQVELNLEEIPECQVEDICLEDLNVPEFDVEIDLEIDF